VEIGRELLADSVEGASTFGKGNDLICAVAHTAKPSLDNPRL